MKVDAIKELAAQRDQLVEEIEKRQEVVAAIDVLLDHKGYIAHKVQPAKKESAAGTDRKKGFAAAIAQLLEAEEPQKEEDLLVALRLVGMGIGGRNPAVTLRKILDADKRFAKVGPYTWSLAE